MVIVASQVRMFCGTRWWHFLFADAPWSPLVLHVYTSCYRPDDYEILSSWLQRAFPVGVYFESATLHYGRRCSLGFRNETVSLFGSGFLVVCAHVSFSHFITFVTVLVRSTSFRISLDRSYLVTTVCTLVLS